MMVCAYFSRTQVLFTPDPVLVVLYSQAAWIPALFSTVLWGWLSTRFRTIREPLMAGFVIFTSALIGMTTIQPGQSAHAIGFSCLLGIGFGAPLILVVTGVQLSTSHRLIATATACTTSSRAIFGAVFSAIDAAALNSRIEKFLPRYVAKAALAAGLPAASVPSFVEALATGDDEALASILGVTPTIIAQGLHALRQAYADSLRAVFIITVPFGVLAVVACYFLGDLKETMNYRVDAPMDILRSEKGSSAEGA